MSQYIARPTGADSKNSRHAPITAWHIHVGKIHLYIVGPGEKAWLRCSAAYYKGQVGTDAERNLARRAIAILLADHHDDRQAGPAEIRAAMDRAAAPAPPVAAMPAPPAAPLPAAVAPVLAPAVCEIVAEVARELGVPAADIVAAGRIACGLHAAEIMDARALCHALVSQRLGIKKCPASRALRRSIQSAAASVARHRQRMISRPAYRAAAAALGCTTPALA